MLFFLGYIIGKLRKPITKVHGVYAEEKEAKQ